ncbi:hypothetical protein M513_12910 [Trichuris suis]|uniref:Uncharacterized protein n=1 Tax=Trichuris suis TaxID=68888 RepID=A0A085LML4_9BILA|nr:hypothetical protein M513_12910 [Trichuris suis]
MLDDRGGFDRLGHDLLWLLPLWASSSFGARPRRCLPQPPARTSTKRRGRPQREQPQKIMAETIKASAVVEHSSQCSHDLQPSIICRESRLHLRRVKEALFIRNNRTINRDKGVEVSAVWDTLISKRKCCSLPG